MLHEFQPIYVLNASFALFFLYTFIPLFIIVIRFLFSPLLAAFIYTYAIPKTIRRVYVHRFCSQIFTPLFIKLTNSSHEQLQTRYFRKFGIEIESLVSSSENNNNTKSNADGGTSRKEIGRNPSPGVPENGKNNNGTADATDSRNTSPTTAPSSSRSGNLKIAIYGSSVPVLTSNKAHLPYIHNSDLHHLYRAFRSGSSNDSEEDYYGGDGNDHGENSDDIILAPSPLYRTDYILSRIRSSQYGYDSVLGSSNIYGSRTSPWRPRHFESVADSYNDINNHNINERNGYNGTTYNHKNIDNNNTNKLGDKNENGNYDDISYVDNNQPYHENDSSANIALSFPCCPLLEKPNKGVTELLDKKKVELTGGKIPPPSGTSCIYAEAYYALPSLHSTGNLSCTSISNDSHNNSGGYGNNNDTITIDINNSVMWTAANYAERQLALRKLQVGEKGDTDDKIQTDKNGDKYITNSLYYRYFAKKKDELDEVSYNNSYLIKNNNEGNAIDIASGSSSILNDLIADFAWWARDGLPILTSNLHHNSASAQSTGKSTTATTTTNGSRRMENNDTPPHYRHHGNGNVNSVIDISNHMGNNMNDLYDNVNISDHQLLYPYRLMSLLFSQSYYDITNNNNASNSNVERKNHERIWNKERLTGTSITHKFNHYKAQPNSRSNNRRLNSRGSSSGTRSSSSRIRFDERVTSYKDNTYSFMSVEQAAKYLSQQMSHSTISNGSHSNHSSNAKKKGKADNDNNNDDNSNDHVFDHSKQHVIVSYGFNHNTIRGGGHRRPLPPLPELPSNNIIYYYYQQLSSIFHDSNTANQNTASNANYPDDTHSPLAPFSQAAESWFADSITLEIPPVGFWILVSFLLFWLLVLRRFICRLTASCRLGFEGVFRSIYEYEDYRYDDYDDSCGWFGNPCRVVSQYLYEVRHLVHCYWKVWSSANGSGGSAGTNGTGSNTENRGHQNGGELTVVFKTKGDYENKRKEPSSSEYMPAVHSRRKERRGWRRRRLNNEAFNLEHTCRKCERGDEKGQLKLKRKKRTESSHEIDHSDYSGTNGSHFNSINSNKVEAVVKVLPEDETCIDEEIMLRRQAIRQCILEALNANTDNGDEEESDEEEVQP